RTPQVTSTRRIGIMLSHAREPRPSEPSTVVRPSSPAPSKAPTPDVARCSALHLISHSCMSKQRPARRRTINIRPQPLCAGSGFMARRVVVVLAGVILVHGVVDAITGRIRTGVSTTRSLAIFAVDQALHVAVLFAAWAILTPDIVAPRWIPADSIPLATGAVVLVAAYVFNWNGGSALVRGVLVLVRLDNAGTPDRGPETRSIQPPGTGHLIGALERLLTLTLVLLGEWSALGFILAAKSIARFKELEDRKFSEYYLLGTLTSVIVATATGLLVRMLLVRG